jgi:hypothetical protein
MANSKQSDNLGSQKKETGSVVLVDRTDLRRPQNHKTQISTLCSSAGNDSRPIATPERDVQRADKAKDSHQFRRPAGVIHIKERYFTMLKKDLILRNPLHVMAYGNDDILSAGQFGAVLARAGVGKTAFLVQLSLNALLRGKNVLHISLEDPVNKVSLWYKEVFNLCCPTGSL